MWFARVELTTLVFHGGGALGCVYSYLPLFLVLVYNLFLLTCIDDGNGRADYYLCCC